MKKITLNQLRQNSHQIFDSSYNKIKFKNQKEFNDWINKKSIAKIEFIDNGQDLLFIKIDEFGEILDTNSQYKVWSKKIIALDKLYEKKNIWILDSEKMCDRKLDFIVDKIILKN